MRAQSDRQMQQLRAEARRHACQDPALGPTLHDGGEIVKELWRILGRTRYHDLVRPLIG